MTPRRRTLLFCAYPVGYGPAAKALTLAARCRSAGLGVVFAGRGVAHELVARSSEVFEEVVHTGAGEPCARTLVRESAAVVSVMDREFASLANEVGRPLHVVDSLLWMRDLVPEPFRPARRYWAQDFDGVRERRAGLITPPTVVGPILADRPGERRPLAGKLVVSVGGFEGADGVDRAYGELVLRALCESRLLTAFQRQVAVLAGASTVQRLGSLAAEWGVELTSLEHAAAVDELATASIVVTAPGLTTALESFRLGRPTFFLPPQNYSQWRILQAFRRRDLAPHALDWADLNDRPLLGDGAVEGGAQVRAAIGKLARTPAAHLTLKRQLSACLDTDRTVLARRQREFFRSLGPNGAPVIAAELGGELE